MRWPATFPTIALMMLASPGLAAERVPDAAAATLADTVTSSCALKARKTEGLVSVVTDAFYNFEFGYFLDTPGCTDAVDGTGVIEIKLPAGKTDRDFPELAKLGSQTWLGQNVGKRPKFRGVGWLSTSRGYAEFTLRSADSVWAEGGD